MFLFCILIFKLFNAFTFENVFQCNGCIKTCTSDEIDCYVIDNNAYIVIAQNVNHTGKFFGDHQGDVMAAMVEKSFFQAINVYDYQALCREEVDDSSDAQALLHVSPNGKK